MRVANLQASIHVALTGLVLSMALVTSTGNLTATSTCDPLADCSLLGPYVSIWAWKTQASLMPNGGVLYSGPTSTATLITIIDKAQNLTTTSLQWPGNYTPATNSAGTRTMVLSYNLQGDSQDWTTVTATYPTPFVAWPTTYGWSPGCTDTPKTETVSGNPQPPNSPDLLPVGMYISDEELEADPEGLSWLAASVFMAYWPWGTMSALWPDQPPLTNCVDDDIGPNWAAFTSTAWYTATSTMYTTDATTASSSSSATPKQTSTSQPMQTSEVASSTETSSSSSETGTNPGPGRGDSGSAGETSIGSGDGSSVSISVEIIVSQVTTVVLTTIGGKATEVSSTYDITTSLEKESGAQGNSGSGPVVTTIIQVGTMQPTTIDGTLTSYSTNVFVTTTLDPQGDQGETVSPETTTLIAVLTELATTINGTPTSFSTTILVTSTIGGSSDDDDNSGSPVTTVLAVPTVISTTINGTPTSYSTNILVTSTLANTAVSGEGSTGSSITTVVDIPTVLSTTINGTPTSFSTTVPVTTTIAEQSAKTSGDSSTSGAGESQPTMTDSGNTSTNAAGSQRNAGILHLVWVTVVSLFIYALI